MFRFGEMPPIGTVITVDQQSYELANTEPHEKLDGGKVELLVWETECQNCREQFVVRTTLTAKYLNRRCGDCVKPGKPVTGKRGRKVQVSMVMP